MTYRGIAPFVLTITLVLCASALAASGSDAAQITPSAAATPKALPDEYTLKINGLLGVPSPGVLKNDEGVSQAELVQQPKYGTLTFNANGSLTYKPAKDFTGRDSFTYRGTSGDIASNLALVFINVNATASGQMSGPSLVCDGDIAALQMQLAGDPPFTVEWEDLITQTSSLTSIVRNVEPVKASIYRVKKLSDKNGPGKMSPDRLTVNVRTRPKSPAITGDTAVELGDPLSLVATGLHESYQWYRDGVAIANATQQSFDLENAMPTDSGVYTVTGRTGNCHSFQSIPALVDVASERILPVVSAADGSYGSRFRSTVQVHNGASVPISGSLEFFGSRPGPTKTTAFTSGPRATLAYHDVTPLLGGEVVGSLDIDTPAGPVLPTSLVRVYNDGGEAGTTGLTVPQVRPRDVLFAGEKAVILVPVDPSSFRFNIGIRTFEAGVDVVVRTYGTDGDLRMVVGRTWAPNSFRQLTAADVIGLPLQGNEALVFEVAAGSALIYGTMVDNRTNDPNLHLAEKVREQPRTFDMVLPVVASVNGGFGSQFRTALQLHNPGDDPLKLDIGFRPALQIAGDPAATLKVTLQPHATMAFSDVLPELAMSGAGSLDIRSTGSYRPVVVARIYNDGPDGQTGATEPALAREDVPRAGDRVILIAPSTPGTLRFNIGVRTLEEGATFDFTVRNAAGAIRAQGRRELATEFFAQYFAADLVGVPLGASDSIEFTIVRGATAIYGAMTDNMTNDPAIQLNKR